MSEEARDLLAIAALAADRVQVMQPPASWSDDSLSGGDLDCWVEGLDPQWPLRLPPGWRLVQALQYGPSQWQWWLEGPHGSEILDTTRARDTGMATEAMMARTEILAPPAVRAAYLSGKGLFEGTKRDPGRWRGIASLASEDSASYCDLLEASFGKTIGGRLADTGLRGVPPDARLVASSRRWRRREWIRSPVGRTAHAALEARRILRRGLFPTGLTVLVAGPDGSGKSTLARGLMSATDTLFRRRQHVHWVPGVLPRGSHVLGRPVGPVSHPHRSELRSVPASYLALAYYWVDSVVGGWVWLRHVRRRTGLVLIERGWWDIAVDPRRYRMRVAPRVVRLLGSALPAPDVVFTLEGPAELLAGRKSELPREEIDRQLRQWRDIAPTLAVTVPLDTSRSIDVCVAEAREDIAQRLEARTLARVGSGWLVPPRSQQGGYLLPRGPAAVAARSLHIYQPMNLKGRVAWEAARLVAKAGGFRLSLRRHAPPHDVREIVAGHIPRRGTVALQRTNHEHRWVALVIDADGRADKLIKLSTATDGSSALQREADNLERFSSRLVPPLLAPRLLKATPNALVFEPVDWSPRWRPWELPADVAYAIGRFACGQGDEEGTIAHGDFAPWNLLMSRNGWVVIDWEEAGTGYPLMFDLFHHLVQSHCLLGRPTQDEIEHALDQGRGGVARAMSSFVSAIGEDRDSLNTEFVRYLKISRAMFDPTLARHAAVIKARDRLLAAREESSVRNGE